MVKTTQERFGDSRLDALSSMLGNTNGYTASKVSRDLKLNGIPDVVAHAANHIAGDASESVEQDEFASARLDDSRRQEDVSTGTYILVMNVS